MRRVKRVCDICGLTQKGCLGHLNIIPTKGMAYKTEGIDARMRDAMPPIQAGTGRTKSEQERVFELEVEMERLIAKPLLDGCID